MNKQQKIFNILAKEQKPMKVDLASMSKLESIYKQLDGIMSNAERGVSDVQNAAVKGLKITEDGLSIANDVLKEIQSIDAAAKELGATVDTDGFKSGALSMQKALQELSLYYKQSKRY